MLFPLILSGGSGTRLWPLSRRHLPKQFLPLASDNSLFADTLARTSAVANVGAPIVVSNNDHRFLVAEQLNQSGLDDFHILLEPCGRNTAPAVAAGALHALSLDDDAMLLVLPSDHLLKDVTAFASAVALAAGAAAKGKLATFGIVPAYPETGYGYIKAAGGEGVLDVEQFVEKPDQARAEQYLAQGGYYWNSGMFLFSAKDYLAELERHAPAMVQAVKQAYEAAKRDLDFIRLDEAAFAKSPADSIDYAVMEKTDQAVVIPLDAGWSDLGSWTSLLDVGEKDAEGNVALGDTMLQDTRDCYVRSDGRLVATLGLQHMVVVETPDAVLVADKDRVQDVKQLVTALEKQGRSEGDFHRKVLRPWGSYEGIAESDRFQVKRIIVKPGERLSVQMHHHRSEHWIVVKGTARVYRGEEEFILSEDQSTYIPLGSKHCLENPGVIPLELIEVQTGSYLGEDDIVRFDDRYGRA